MTDTSGSASIGWIGTGVMGAPMAGHLLKAGHQLTVFNRTRVKAEDLIAAGSVDVVFSMLGFPADVRGTLLEPGGVLDSMRPGSLLIDMTTSEPSLAV